MFTDKNFIQKITLISFMLGSVSCATNTADRPKVKLSEEAEAQAQDVMRAAKQVSIAREQFDASRKNSIDNKAAMSSERTDEEVKNAARMYRQEIDKGVGQAFRENADVSGPVKAKFNISANGHIESCELDPPTLNENRKAVESFCSAVSKIYFGRKESGKSYPFALTFGYQK
jgi:hypothetical protein